MKTEHFHLRTTASTNREAMRLGLSRNADSLWVTADEQTAGVGRRGRVWHSPKGNLYASLFLRFAGSTEKVGALPLLGAYALHEAIAALLPEVAVGLKIKWPNDLLLDGSKIAGLLLENSPLDKEICAIVIGFGVNCCSHPKDVERPAGNLSQATGRIVSPQALFGKLVETIPEALENFKASDGMAWLCQSWLLMAMGVGETITVRFAAHTLTGIFENIDETGHLVLRDKTGKRHIIASGDVFFDTEKA